MLQSMQWRRQRLVRGAGQSKASTTRLLGAETVTTGGFTGGQWIYGKDLATKNAFNCLLNAGNDDDAAIEARRLFQARTAVMCAN